MAQAGAPTLSVIITVYNGEEDLPRALDSLRAQTFDDFELLVVDNGSNDGTWEVIQELSWRRMRGHRLKERRHEVDAFTQALAWAQGTYVVHHGAGDVSEPGRFEAQIARMKRGRTLGAVGAYARWVDAEGGTLREIKPPSGHKAILEWLEREDAEFVLGIARGAAMLNREALEDVGGFRTALGHAAFLDIWLRLAASDYKLANVTTPLYTVQFNPAAPYIRFHAEARAFATLARDLTKGDGEKAAGAEGEKAGAPLDALKAEAKPPVDKGDHEAAEAAKSPESAGEGKPAAAKVDAGGKPPADAKPAEAKSAPEAGATEQKEKDEGEEAEKPEGDKPVEAGKPAEAAEKAKLPETKVDAEDKPPAGDKPAETKSAPESGEVPDEEKKDEGEKPEEKAEKPAGAKSTGEDVKAEAEKPVAEGEPPAGEKPVEAGEKSEAGGAEGEKKREAEDKEAKKPEKEEKPVEASKPEESAEKEPPAKPEAGGKGEPPAGKKLAEAGEKSEAGAAEGEKKGEAEDKEAEKPEEEDKPVEAGKPEESAGKATPAKPEAGEKGETPAGKKPAEAGEKSEAGEGEGEKKSEAGEKEAEKPEEEDKPVEAGKATEPTEKGFPAKSEGGGKGETPAGQKPTGAGETSEAGKPEEDKKGEAGGKEAKKPEKSGPVEAGDLEVSTEKMTPVERARRLAAERADRGLAARLRERSDNYLAWAGRFEEWGGAAGEHVRQMWTRALLAYPLNPQVWAFAYRRLADRYLGGGDQDDAGSEA